MKEIKPNTSYDKGKEYYPMEQDGVILCSCGRELIKLDEGTYRCTGGYPTYRFEEGTIVIDKFGNMLLKRIDHGDTEQK